MCLSRSGVAQQQRLQASVEDERRDGVDELRLEQLDRRDLGEQQPPGVALAQVDLLQVLVEPALGKEVALPTQILRQERDLRQLGGARDADERRAAAAVRAPAGSISVAAQPLVLAEQPRTCAGIVRSDAVSASSMWR